MDLWQRFLAKYLQHEVELLWVKGHAGIADNELCDQLASRARSQGRLSIDDEFVRSRKPSEHGGASIAKQTNVKSRGPKPKQVGDPCRHCSRPLIRREPKKQNPDSAYYFAWYLYCQACKRIYHVESAKVHRKDAGK